MPVLHDTRLQALNTMIRGEYALRLSELQDRKDYEKLATIVNSNAMSNTYSWLSRFPKIREWIGERSLRSMKETSYTLLNKKYESTLEIDRTDIEDDNLGIYKPLSRAQADEVIRFFNEQICLLIRNGFNNLCYDGQRFFDVNHPLYSNEDGTGNYSGVSNIQGNPMSGGISWYLLSLEGTLKPFILQERMKPEMQSITESNSSSVFLKDKYLYGIRYRGSFGYGFWQQAVASREPLNAYNFESARTIMRSFKRDGGSPMGIRPTHVLVPASLESTARSLFETQLIDNGKSNVHYKAVEVMVSDFL